MFFLTTSELRVYTLESRQANARNKNSAVNRLSETGLDSEIAKTNHGNAQPMVVTQNANNVLEDCLDQTSLLGDAEPRLNVFHTHVAGSFSVSLVTGPI